MSLASGSFGSQSAGGHLQQAKPVAHRCNLLLFQILKNSFWYCYILQCIILNTFILHLIHITLYYWYIVLLTIKTKQ